MGLVAKVPIGRWIHMLACYATIQIACVENNGLATLKEDLQIPKHLSYANSFFDGSN